MVRDRVGGRFLGSLRASYAGRAFGARENRTAAAITLGVLVLVAAIARIPLPADFEIDLREPDRRGGLRSATPIGFSEPNPFGRNALGETARIVTNRPLPATFTLVVEARAASPIEVVVAVGETRHTATFDRRPGVETITVDNPGGAREIAFRTVAARDGAPHPLAVRRIEIR